MSATRHSTCTNDTCSRQTRVYHFCHAISSSRCATTTFTSTHAPIQINWSLQNDSARRVRLHDSNAAPIKFWKRSGSESRANSVNGRRSRRSYWPHARRLLRAARNRTARTADRPCQRWAWRSTLPCMFGNGLAVQTV